MTVLSPTVITIPVVDTVGVPTEGVSATMSASVTATVTPIAASATAIPPAVDLILSEPSVVVIVAAPDLAVTEGA